MNRHAALLLVGSLILAACVPNTSTNYSMGGMNHGDSMMGNTDAGTFLPGQDIDIASLPEAKPSDILEVRDGDTIDLNPTIVRKRIGTKDIAMYGYNGRIPGPTIKVQQGASFTVRVMNDIDRPTSVHWHGLRLDNASDGAVGMTQNAIEPGDEFTYTVTVPDEGLYWYHTHVREDLQQPMGLYGAILVSPDTPDSYASVDREETVILNDLLVDANGMPVPYGKNEADHTLMGRFGTVFLVNGMEPRPMDAGLGDIVRFSVLNASNTRTYRIVQPEGSFLKIIGNDNGRYEREFFTDSFILSPSERVIVEVYFWDEGVNRGNLSQRLVTFVESGPPSDPVPVVSVNIVGGVVGPDRLSTFKTTRTHDDVRESINPFRPFFDKPVDHTLVLTMSMHGGMNNGMGGMMGDIPADGIEWEDEGMNAMPMGNMMQWRLVDPDTGKSNKDLMWTAKVGDMLKIRIVNDKNAPHPMQHPIHFHGQRFLVLSENGVTNKNLAWKDTVLVPAGHTVDILLDVSNPGDWMFHCHIAEHLSNGMMGMLKVLP